MYTVKFSDGTEIGGFIADEWDLKRLEEIPGDIFTPARMRDIEIVADTPEEGGNTFWLLGKHDVLRFGGITHDTYDNYWYLSLCEVEESVREREKLKGDIAYIAMMMGVEL